MKSHNFLVCILLPDNLQDKFKKLDWQHWQICQPWNYFIVICKKNHVTYFHCISIPWNICNIYIFVSYLNDRTCVYDCKHEIKDLAFQHSNLTKSATHCSDLPLSLFSFYFLSFFSQQNWKHPEFQQTEKVNFITPFVKENIEGMTLCTSCELRGKAWNRFPVSCCL